MSDAMRKQGGNRVRELAEKLARSEQLSQADRADLEAALTPVSRPLAAKALRRHLAFRGSYPGTLEDVMQDAWVIMLDEILPAYDSRRGHPFPFVRRCLRWRLINLLTRGKEVPTRPLPPHDALPDMKPVDWDKAATADEVRTLLERALATANLRSRQIVLLWMKGEPHAKIAGEVGMSEVAVRGVVFRLLRDVRAAEAKPSS